MSFHCDRCEQQVETFGVRYVMSMDFDPDEPDHPPDASMQNGHLCTDCRAEFRDFMAYA